MQEARNEVREIRTAAPATVGEALDAHDDDPTTLKFNGRVAVADEDAGSDPYNRTGKFRRLIRG
jgi:hypothetical protein